MGEVKRNNQNVVSAPRAPLVPWETFTRFRSFKDFYGCIREDGTWEDSAVAFNTAVYFACMADGMSDLETLDKQLNYVQTAKWNIVHSSMLKQMYEAGIIK